MHASLINTPVPGIDVVEIRSHRDREVYSLGVRIAQELRKSRNPLDYDLLLQGLRDELEERALPIVFHD